MGTACAAVANTSGYPIGERHAVLCFSRQPSDTESDWELAASHLVLGEWTDVELQQASTVAAEMIDADPAARASYDRAIAEGWAIIVFSEPV